jgi:hypothetical protein
MSPTQMTLDKSQRLVQSIVTSEEKLKWLQIWNSSSFKKENKGFPLELPTKKKSKAMDGKAHVLVPFDRSCTKLD